MRLSGLVVAATLLVSATLFAQHTSGTSNSSSSAHSSGSSGSSASHASSSGGSRASAGSHSSSSSASHVASAGTSASHFSAQSSRPKGEPAVAERNQRAPDESAKLRAKESPKLTATEKEPEPEKKDQAPEKKGSHFFFRHHFRKRKPVQSAAIKPPAPCKKEPCAVCPPGEARKGTGACAVPAAMVANNRCLPGQPWNGAACVANGSDCAMYSSRAAILANELRGVRSEMERACSGDRSGHQCLELTGQHDGALLRYRGLLNEAPASCRTMLPDPLSL